EVSVFETNVPPRFRLYFCNAKGKTTAPLPANSVSVETIRSDGNRQSFAFDPQGDYLEATEELPEPHEFKAILKLKQGGRTEKREVQFVEDDHHHHHRDGGVHDPGRNFAEIK